MSDEVPPARQCTFPSCENEATDPMSDGSLCDEHLKGLGQGSETTETSKPDDSGTAEPDISTPTPTSDDEKDGRDAAVDALDDAIAYFTSKLDSTIADHSDNGTHPDRPTTGREYFRQRGWNDETIDEMRLGWAPASRTGLLDHLMSKGHDRDAIIGTGLFTDDLSPLWQGRYVLPYFDANGDPVYAIGRCSGAKGGGRAGYDGHPSDGLAGKYAKLRHTDDRVPFEEPIWGRHTLEDGAPVVVAEGIADAITAAELGYSTLSPVAKEFKHEHIEPLIEIFEEHNVPTVTIIPDSERAAFSQTDAEQPESIREAVSIPATSPGMGGALRTADHLREADIDVRVADLPLPSKTDDFHKVDLDDYIHGWGDDLDAILAAAKPPEASLEYDAATRTATTPTDDDRGDHDPAEAVGKNTSELWSLDLGDLEGLKDGDRTKNPFAHTGDSETYFVVRKQSGGDLIATDYKGSGGSVTYNALTALLVDAGKRSRDNPEGSLSDLEVWYAWKQARKRGDLGDGDPVPYRALRAVAIDSDIIDEDELVHRSQNTGRVVDDGTEEDTYLALPPGVYNSVLEKAEERLGKPIGREPVERPATDDNADENDEGRGETGRELLGLDVVVEPANALAAAAAIEVDDLDKPLPELERDDVDDVAIAVALSEGWISSPDEFPDDGRYTDAYYRARDHYGAPLPKYLDNSTLEEREDLVFAALDRVKPEHIIENCLSEVTVPDPSGKATAKLDPHWEDSESGERIIAGYGRGFYCVKHGISFSPLQLVALEHDLIFTEADYPRGEAFKQAYRLLREEYRAPIPKWRATVLEHVAVLPPATRVLGDASTDRSLEDAHKQTESLLRDAVNVRNRAQLITTLPGTGKTFGSAVVSDDRPVLYLAPRNELKEQMEAYAAEVRETEDIDAEPTVQHLPILAEKQFDELVRTEAAEAVRENGRWLLRDRAALLEHVTIPDVEEADGETEEDEIDLDRPVCPTANGEYGEEWALTVQTARQLGHRPAEIHEHDTALFGEQLPCQHDGDCPYTTGWDRVRDPGSQDDILIGSPGHAGVGSATTYFERDASGDRVETPRAVVIDEFPGDTFVDSYGAHYLDFSTWLANSLVGIDNREDLLDERTELDENTWVNSWINGDGADYGLTDDTIDLLVAGKKLCDARQAATDLLNGSQLDTVTAADGVLVDDLETILTAFRDGFPTSDQQARLNEISGLLADLADDVYAKGDREDAGQLYALSESVSDVLAGLNNGVGNGDTIAAELRDAIDSLPVGGDLETLLTDTVHVLEGDDPRDGLLTVAIDVLRGGREGCRELSIYADDGYAHPDAWALLAGALATDTVELTTGAFAFDDTEGGVYKRLDVNDATVVADKNHHGALVVDPPGFTDITGAKCPVIGLDATGRTQLWRHAIGRDVERRDIHETDAQRRGFLREMGHRVVQTTDKTLAYHGSPGGKNFGEDLELVRAVAEQYTGNGSGVIDEKGPAVISTLKVLEHLGDDLEEHAGEMVNYENMKGSDALGDHQVAVILGSQHYGDHNPEMWALIAGESAARGDGWGSDLDYGSEVANEYLRYMREDHVMQAILRAGRNDEDTVVFAHTSALRPDLPVEKEAAVLSAHSEGTLAVTEAAAKFNDRAFNVEDVLEAIENDDRAVGRRQVQTIIGELRESGYIRALEEPRPGVSGEYELEEDPGTADIELPEPEISTDEHSQTNEKSRMKDNYTWNFVSRGGSDGGQGKMPPARATIPAGDAADRSLSDPTTG